MLQQENAIQTMELRNHFSLYCLHQEMQLVHAYLPLTSHILGAFVNSQIQGHKEVGSPAPPLKTSLGKLVELGRARDLKRRSDSCLGCSRCSSCGHPRDSPGGRAVRGGAE